MTGAERAERCTEHPGVGCPWCPDGCKTCTECRCSCECYTHQPDDDR